MKDLHIKDRLAVLGWTVRAFVHNLRAELSNRRLENKKRRWTAHKVGGGGVVPLGRVNQETAIAKTTKFGSVSYVDTEVAIVFYGDMYVNV